MAFCDFAVKFDPEKDTAQTICKKVLASIILTPIKHNKPVYLFISGDSGQGKSWAGLKLQEILLELQGLDPMTYFLSCNVFTPLEYAQKLDNLLFNK